MAWDRFVTSLEKITQWHVHVCLSVTETFHSTYTVVVCARLHGVDIIIMFLSFHGYRFSMMIHLLFSSHQRKRIFYNGNML